MMGLRQRAREHRAPLRNGVTARGYTNEAPARNTRRARPARPRAAHGKAPSSSVERRSPTPRCNTERGPAQLARTMLILCSSGGRKTHPIELSWGGVSDWGGKAREQQRLGEGLGGSVKGRHARGSARKRPSTKSFRARLGSAARQTSTSERGDEHHVTRASRSRTNGSNVGNETSLPSSARR